MKLAEKLIKLGLAIVAVAGIAFLVVKYMDCLKAWLAKFCPCCASEEEYPVAVENVEEPVAEDVPEEAVEAPAVEVAVPEGTPVGEATDFEE